MKEATNAGLQCAGIDVQLCEIGEVIQEVRRVGGMVVVVVCGSGSVW